MNEKTRNFVKVFSNCFLIGKNWKYWIKFFGIEYDKLKPTFLFDEQKKSYNSYIISSTTDCGILNWCGKRVCKRHGWRVKQCKHVIWFNKYWTPVRSTSNQIKTVHTNKMEEKNSNRGLRKVFLLLLLALAWSFFPFIVRDWVYSTLSLCYHLRLANFVPRHWSLGRRYEWFKWNGNGKYWLSPLLRQR